MGLHVRRVIVGAGLGLVVCLAASAAQAADAFSILDRLCIATHADPKKTLKLADAAGWTTVDPAQTPATPPSGVTISSYAVRMIDDGPVVRILIVGEGEMVSGPAQPVFPVDMCMLISRPIDAAAEARADRWSGAQPLSRPAPGAPRVYAVQDGPPYGRRGVHPGSDEVQAAMRAGKVSLLLTSSDPERGYSTIGYLATKLQ